MHYRHTNTAITKYSSASGVRPLHNWMKLSPGPQHQQRREFSRHQSNLQKVAETLSQKEAQAGLTKSEFKRKRGTIIPPNGFRMVHAARVMVEEDLEEKDYSECRNIVIGPQNGPDQVNYLRLLFIYIYITHVFNIAKNRYRCSVNFSVS